MRGCWRGPDTLAADREGSTARERNRLVNGRLHKVAAAIGLLVLLAVLAGCGGNGRHDDGGMMGGSTGMMGGRQPTVPDSPTGPRSAATSPAGSAAGANARALFLASGCGGCHELAAAGTTGTAGPNLDQAHPSYELAVRRLTEGGAGMPAFAGSLTAVQIRAVARYVAGATR